MAKFCTKCGNKLDETGVCTCEKPIYHNQAVPAENTIHEVIREAHIEQSGSTNENEYSSTYNKEVDYNEKASQAKEVLTVGYNKVMNILMRLIKYPMTKGIAFSNSEDMKSSSIIIGLHALLTAIFTVISFSRMNEAASIFTDLLNGFIGYGSMMNLEFPLTNIFMITLIGSAVFSMIYAGTLLLASIIFKNNVSYKAVVCSITSRSAILIPVILIAIILQFISPFLGFAFFAIGNFAGVAYITQVFPVTKKEYRNHVPLIVTIGTILFLAASYFILKNSYSAFLPQELKEIVPYFNELLNSGW